jgi:hypothetical protein
MARTGTRKAVEADGAPRRSWRLALHGQPPGPNQRLHWAKRARLTRHWKGMALVWALCEQIPRLSRIRISAVIYRRRLGLADEDNDMARLKPILDGIVAAGVIPTDTRAYVTWGEVSEARGAPGVEIVVEEVE